MVEGVVKLNRSTDLTKRKLRDAFLSLMRSKKLEEIKVVEIANEAGISRKTFYDHYADIHDLAYDCFRTYLCGDIGLRVLTLGDPQDLVSYLVDAFQRNLEFCKANPSFSKMVYEDAHYSRYLSRIVEDGIVSMVHSVEDVQPTDSQVRRELFPDIDVVARLYFIGIGMLTRDWFDRGMVEPSRLVAQRITYMAFHLSDIYSAPTGACAVYKELLLDGLENTEDSCL